MTGTERLESRLSLRSDAVRQFALRHRIYRLSFFGSVVRADFDDRSDVDVLVEFVPGHTPGLLRLAEMELELSAIIGRKVDLNTAGFLHPRFRDEVIESALVYFEAA